MRSEAEIRRLIERTEHSLTVMAKLETPFDLIASAHLRIDVCKWVLGEEGTATGLVEKFTDDIESAITSHSHN